jgi:hypothetical protein
MKHQGHFKRTATSRDALQIGELIADLDRIVRLLNNDIAAEGTRASFRPLLRDVPRVCQDAPGAPR